MGINMILLKGSFVSTSCPRSKRKATASPLGLWPAQPQAFDQVYDSTWEFPPVKWSPNPIRKRLANPHQTHHYCAMGLASQLHRSSTAECDCRWQFFPTVCTEPSGTMRDSQLLPCMRHVASSVTESPLPVLFSSGGGQYQRPELPRGLPDQQPKKRKLTPDTCVFI